MNIPETLQDLKQWDNRRQGFPGEHWLTLGAGMLLMKRAGRSRSFLGRMVGRSLGAALMARAASSFQTCGAKKHNFFCRFNPVPLTTNIPFPPATFALHFIAFPHRHNSLEWSCSKFRR